MYNFDPTSKIAVTAEEFVAPLELLLNDQIELNEIHAALIEAILTKLPMLVEQNKTLPTHLRMAHLFSMEKVLEESEAPLRMTHESNTRMLATLRDSAQRLNACAHVYRERALGLIYRLDTMIVELDKAITDYEKKVKCVLAELYVG